MEIRYVGKMFSCYFAFYEFEADLNTDELVEIKKWLFENKIKNNIWDTGNSSERRNSTRYVIFVYDSDIAALFRLTWE